MRVRTRIVAALLPALLLAGCGSGAPNAVLEESLATAGDASGLLLAYGTVERDGKPLEGATVVLQAMPVTSAADADAGAQRWSAPAVRTDADGNYELRLDPADIPAEYYPDSYSFLEFDLVFGDGAGLAVWHGMVFLRTRPDLWRTEGAGPDDGVLRVGADLGAGAVEAFDSRGEPVVVG